MENNSQPIIKNTEKDIIEDKLKDEKIFKSFKLKNKLSSIIFDFIGGEYKMKSNIREKLLEISEQFLNTLDFDFFIYDIILVGSLSNYNWSKYSDIDLHIIVDYSEIVDNSNQHLKPIISSFFKMKKDNWNERYGIKIKNYSVEVYVQDINEKPFSSGVYSILNDNWIKTPIKDKIDLDKNAVLDKSDFFVKKIDSLNDENNINKINDLLEKIKKLRKSGLEKGGEFSYENLTFKLLRRNGAIKKLISLKNKIINKKFSIK